MRGIEGSGMRDVPIVTPALSVLLVVRRPVVSSAAADFAAREGMRTD
jgi:hypothetical protein